jgi:phosphoribosylglycinamide formyltransferase-1
MPASFVSEPITPLGQSFDTSAMARGEPGLPQQFRWREKDFHLAEVLDHWKEHGPCANGSGERYLRKHAYRVRTTDGSILQIYFQRSFGRGKFRLKSRWCIQTIAPPGHAHPKKSPPRAC